MQGGTQNQQHTRIATNYKQGNNHGLMQQCEGIMTNQ
jgi:hypothetical protein